MTAIPELTVWYNTRCSVCNAGINSQQRKLVALVKQGRVAFRDINFEPDALKQFGASLEDIHRRLHATDARGKLITGADVMVALWRITPRQQWLAAILGNAGMLPVTRFCYDRFADVLYAWNRRRGHW
jgi:predicted DCC family thiol-disulfide oxidoreductase YuxK